MHQISKIYLIHDDESSIPHIIFSVGSQKTRKNSNRKYKIKLKKFQ